MKAPTRVRSKRSEGYVLFGAALVAACSAAPPGTARDRERSVHPPPPATASTASGAVPPTSASATPLPPSAASAASAASANGAASAASAFPPRDFAPPHARSSAPGDGVWAPMPEFEGRATPPALLRSVVHPHPIKKHVHVTLVAMDLSRVEVTLRAGLDDPPNREIAAADRPAIVPPELGARALAVFNGGWLHKHGRFGMAVGAQQFAPPKPGACTVALLSDGSVEVATWERLEARAPGLRAWRQAPPCLLEGGARHAELTRRPNQWGLSAEGKADIRRSALGVDATRRVAYFALGEWLTAAELAAGLSAAGLTDAAELDINWSYTRFFALSPEGAGLRISATLLPDLKHLKGEYTVRPASRDFFYVALR
jgi:hypothetical protein